jgi:hypothetical protein
MTQKFTKMTTAMMMMMTMITLVRADREVLCEFIEKINFMHFFSLASEKNVSKKKIVGKNR